eukprot:7876661-Lingulodinium_polyedra.AAC.1
MDAVLDVAMSERTPLCSSWAVVPPPKKRVTGRFASPVLFCRQARAVGGRQGPRILSWPFSGWSLGTTRVGGPTLFVVSFTDGRQE